MTEAQAVEAMLEHWENGWEGLHPEDPDDPDHVKVVYDNEAAVGVPLWARVTIIETLRQQTTSGPKGTRRFEVRGRIAVQLFAEVDQGSGPITALSDDVRTVLQGQTIAVGSEEIALFETVGAAITTDARWAMRLIATTYLYQCIG